jgi:preprotein translocase subunit SecA
MRRQLLEGANQKDRIAEIVTGIVGSFIDQYCPEGARYHQYNLAGLQNAVLNQFGVKIDVAAVAEMDRRELETHVLDVVTARYKEKEEMIGPENLRHAERIIMLNVVDNQWKDHLLSMDHLKEGIGLRGYGQKDPLIEYKKESFTMFQDMMDRMEDETIRYLYFMRIETGPPPLPYPEIEDEDEDEDETESADGARPQKLRNEPDPALLEAQRREAQQSVLDLTRNIQKKKDQELAALQFSTNGNGNQGDQGKETVNNRGVKIGRNDLCPCGSGKKYKKCHGATA